MAPRTPPGARPKWQPTPAERAAMDAGIARLNELHGPPTETEIWVYKTYFAPALETVLARKQSAGAA